MLRPGLSIYQANKGHMSRLLILVLLKLDFSNSQDWSEYWKNKLKEYKVIPDILSSEPPQALGVSLMIFMSTCHSFTRSENYRSYCYSMGVSYFFFLESLEYLHFYFPSYGQTMESSLLSPILHYSAFFFHFPSLKFLL